MSAAAGVPQQAREALIKSARADAERFCLSRKFKKWRNTVCISHFLNCTDVVKDPAFRRRRFIQRFPSVLYLWRPWVAERGCSGQEQALSASHRTGGFCVLPDEKPRSLLKAESACSGVGGVAKWRGKAQRNLIMERHHRGSQRDIKPNPATPPVRIFL